MMIRTAALFINGKNQVVRIPREFEFEGVAKVEICKKGESIILTPKRKSWASFADVEKADADFLAERPDMLGKG